MRRRELLALMTATATSTLLPGFARAAVRGRRLALHNLHTGESLDLDYSVGGKLLPDACAAAAISRLSP